MADDSAVFSVESPIGLIHIVIGGVNRGSAWMDGEVTVNRIPHKVSGVDWSVGWNDKVHAGSSYSVQRVDKVSYGSQTTWGAYEKITKAIEAAVEQIRAEQGANFEHLGRLAVLRGAKNTHEAQAAQFRRQIEDLTKKIAEEEVRAESAADRLAELTAQGPDLFQREVDVASLRGQEAARKEIANLGGTPEGEGWSAIWDLEKSAAEARSNLDKLYPAAHITAHARYAYYSGYIKVCEDTREALLRADRAAV